MKIQAIIENNLGGHRKPYFKYGIYTLVQYNDVLFWERQMHCSSDFPMDHPNISIKLVKHLDESENPKFISFCEEDLNQLARSEGDQ